MCSLPPHLEPLTQEVILLSSAARPVAAPSRRLSGPLGLFEGGNRPKLLCMSPLGWMVQEKKDKPRLVGGSASACAMCQWVWPAPVTQPCTRFFPFYLQTHISITAGVIQNTQSLWAPWHMPHPSEPSSISRGMDHIPPRLEKFMFNNCLTLRALPPGFIWARCA